MTAYAVVIHPDPEGFIDVDEIQVGQSQYQFIKDRLDGGWLEAVRVDDDVVAYIDEEGKLKRLPLNTKATMLWHASEYGVRADVLVGPVVLVGNPVAVGEDVFSSGLEGAVLERVLEALR